MAGTADHTYTNKQTYKKKEQACVIIVYLAIAQPFKVNPGKPKPY
jgi:hypothetical protein